MEWIIRDRQVVRETALAGKIAEAVVSRLAVRMGRASQAGRCVIPPFCNPDASSRNDEVGTTRPFLALNGVILGYGVQAAVLVWQF